MSYQIKRSPTHIKALSVKLQHEVDSIMETISDDSFKLTVERSEEVDVYNDNQDMIIEDFIDQRLVVSPIAKRRQDRKILKKPITIQQPEVTKKIGSAVQFLFKPFEY